MQFNNINPPTPAADTPQPASNLPVREQLVRQAINPYRDNLVCGTKN